MNDFQNCFNQFSSGVSIGAVWYTTACSTSRNTGTPEHHGTSLNIPEHPKTRNTPIKPGTPPKNPEDSKKTRNTPKKLGTPPRKSGTPQKNRKSAKSKRTAIK